MERLLAGYTLRENQPNKCWRPLLAISNEAIVQTVYKVVKRTRFLNATGPYNTNTVQLYCLSVYSQRKQPTSCDAINDFPAKFTSTSREPYPDLGSDTWFFRRHFAGNQRLRRTMSAVFTGYWVCRPQWLAWVENTRMTETQSVAELKYILLAEVLHPMKRKETDNEGPNLWLWSL